MSIYIEVDEEYIEAKTIGDNVRIRVGELDKDEDEITLNVSLFNKLIAAVNSLS